MEKKRTLYSLESDIRRILEDNDFVSTCDERGKQWYINLVSDLAIYIQQELDKAREEGRIQQLKEDIEQVKIFLPEQVSDTDKYWIPMQILLELENDLSKLKLGESKNGKE